MCDECLQYYQKGEEVAQTGHAKYRRLFPRLYADIQSRKYPLRGDTIQYIYTDSKHSNPLCRVTPIEKLKSLTSELEMILDAAETLLRLFGFDRTVYSNFKKERRKGGMKN